MDNSGGASTAVVGDYTDCGALRSSGNAFNRRPVTNPKVNSHSGTQRIPTGTLSLRAACMANPRASVCAPSQKAPGPIDKQLETVRTMTLQAQLAGYRSTEQARYKHTQAQDRWSNAHCEQVSRAAAAAAGAPAAAAVVPR